MISKYLVIKTQEGDMSSSKVIGWLNEIDTVRINDMEISDLKINVNDKTITLLGKKIIHMQFSFWYRRGQFNLSFPKLKSQAINNFLGLEHFKANEFILFFFKNNSKYKIGSYDDEIKINKLIILTKAMEAGLDIPNSWLQEVEDVGSKLLITKPISNYFSKAIGRSHVYIGNGIIEKPLLKHSTNSFVQEYSQKGCDGVLMYSNLYVRLAIIGSSDQNLIESSN